MENLPCKLDVWGLPSLGRMPLKNLLLVRHGEGAEPNYSTPNPDTLTLKPDWPLSQKGLRQAEVTSPWIQGAAKFDRFLSSPLRRAKDTAKILSPQKWQIIPELRERSHGGWENIDRKIQKGLLPEILSLRKELGLDWTKPGGETIRQVVWRLWPFFEWLKTNAIGQNVLIVGHGDQMRATRVLIENLTWEQFLAIDNSTNPLDIIQPCGVIHYSSLNPITGQDEGTLRWIRFVCPWDQSLSTNQWEAF